MFMFVMFIMGCFCQEHLFIQKASLFTPYVDDSGKSVNWNIIGDYLIKVRGNSESFLQLGYFSPETSGAVLMSHPIGSEKFSVDLSIKVVRSGGEEEEGNEGIAIWMSKEDTFEGGSCFGRSCEFNGLVVLVKAYGKTCIGTKAGNVHINPKDPISDLDSVVYRDIPHNSFINIRISQDETALSVYVGNSRDDLSLVYSYRSGIVGKENFLGVSAHTGRSRTVFKLFSIEGYHIKGSQNRYAREEVGSGGVLIWLLFLIAIVVIGYYLYTIQVKGKN